MTSFTNSSQTDGMEMDQYEDDLMFYDTPTGPEMDMVYVIQTYFFPLIMLMGIVGNVLAIPTLYVISTRNWSTVLYLSLLSIVDLLILLVRCGDIWYYQVTLSSLSDSIMNSSDALCKTYMFAFHFVLHLSPWLMVAVAVEMTIASRWPRRLYVMCTLERANNVVMLLVILIVCLDINYFWTWGVPTPTLGCRYTEQFSTQFQNTIWPAMTNVIQFLMPLVLVSACIFVTATTMISRREHVEKSIERELKKYFLELTTLRDFRVVCLIISLVFMCLTFFTIVINLVDFLQFRGFLVLDEEVMLQYSLIMMVLKTLDMTFYALFYSLKIFIYIGCSSTFRKTLIQGFVCLRQRVKRALVTIPKQKRNKKRKEEEERRKFGNSSNHQRKPLIANASSYSGKPEEICDEDNIVMMNSSHKNSASPPRNRVVIQDHIIDVERQGTNV